MAVPIYSSMALASRFIVLASVAIPFQLAADPLPRLGASSHTVAPPDLRVGAKSEATAPPQRAALPTSDVNTRKVSVRHPHRTKLAAFEPGAAREHAKLDDIARSWKSNTTWDAITIDSYVAPRAASDAQRTADQVRSYLVQHGVPAGFVVVVGHAADPSRPAASIEISVTTCDDVTIVCRK